MKRLYRSKNDKLLGGVCGGVGEYLGFDPVLVRLGLAFVVALNIISLVPAFVVYIVAWLIVPEDRKSHVSTPQKTVEKSKKQKKKTVKKSKRQKK
ncbi:MAG: PspC domain-containing protein [Candidatus Micrarchaeota archaeon]